MDWSPGLRLADCGCGRGAVLGHVVRTDVDGIGAGLFHELDLGGLALIPGEDDFIVIKRAAS